MSFHRSSFIPTLVAVFIGSGAMGLLHAEQGPPPPPVPPIPPGMEGERPSTPRVVMMRVAPGMGGGDFADFDLQPRMLERLAEQLELTPKQLGKFTEYAAEARPQMRQMREELTTQSRRLRQLSPGDASFDADSTDAARKMGELTTRMAKQNAELRAKMWRELTPDQRSKWQSMPGERRIELRESAPRKERIIRRIERRVQ